jgi:hypothetical protein
MTQPHFKFRTNFDFDSFNVIQVIKKSGGGQKLDPSSFSFNGAPSLTWALNVGRKRPFFEHQCSNQCSQAWKQKKAVS